MIGSTQRKNHFLKAFNKSHVYPWAFPGIFDELFTCTWRGSTATLARHTKTLCSYCHVVTFAHSRHQCNILTDILTDFCADRYTPEGPCESCPGESQGLGKSEDIADIAIFRSSQLVGETAFEQIP